FLDDRVGLGAGVSSNCHARLGTVACTGGSLLDASGAALSAWRALRAGAVPLRARALEPPEAAELVLPLAFPFGSSVGISDWYLVATSWPTRRSPGGLPSVTSWPTRRSPGGLPSVTSWPTRWSPGGLP